LKGVEEGKAGSMMTAILDPIKDRFQKSADPPGIPDVALMSLIFSA